jgi:hypothetical protein
MEFGNLLNSFDRMNSEKHFCEFSSGSEWNTKSFSGFYRLGNFCFLVLCGFLCVENCSEKSFCELELFSSENGLLWGVKWMNSGMKLNLNGRETF